MYDGAGVGGQVLTFSAGFAFRPRPQVFSVHAMTTKNPRRAVNVVRYQIIVSESIPSGSSDFPKRGFITLSLSWA